MTKTKKINKIIPAVLLSGAMIVPVSQLTSPVAANAYENSSYTQKAIDYRPTITSLVDADFKNSTSRSITRSNDARNNDNLVIPANGEIIVDLEGKDYHQFNATLSVPEGNGSIRYKVYLDDRYIRDTGYINPGDKEDINVELFNDDAKELKIVATSSSNSRANNSGVVENGNFTTYYTSYTEEIGQKSVKYVWSDYQRASHDSAYIGTHRPSAPIYLKANRDAEFATYSTDPYETGSNRISSELKKVTDGTTVISRTNRDVSVYGTGCRSYTLGVRIQYKCTTLKRARQYHNSKGEIFRSHMIECKTSSPVGGTEQYKTITTN